MDTRRPLANRSLRFSTDKSGSSSGRSRGKAAYPIPTGFLENEAPKFRDGKIRHVSDLTDEQFSRFMEAFSAGRTESYEKVDGSVAILFGFDQVGLWTAKKTGLKRRSAESYGRTHEVSARRAHAALESMSRRLAAVMPEGAFATADVIDGPLPNTIRYDGTPRIVVHAMYDGAGIRVDESALGGIEESGGWRIAVRTPVVIENIVAEDLSKLTRLEAESRLVASLSEIRSEFGADQIEGIVVRNLDDGSVVKVVDRDRFTALNRFYWEWRERLDRGFGPKGSFQKGVLRQWRESLAERAIGNRTVLSPSFAAKLIESAAPVAGVEPTVAAMAHLHAVGMSLGGWSEKRFVECWHETRAACVRLWEQWSTAKAGQKYPIEISERTDLAFRAARDRLEEIAGRGGSTVAAVMREVIGENAFERLVLRMGEGLDYDRSRKEELMQYIGEKFSPVVKKLNSEHEGFFSDVFLLRDGSVLKVTNEESGADAAFRLKGKTLPGVAKIEGVGLVPEKFWDPRSGKKKVYWIQTEHLQPISPEEKRELDGASSFLNVLFLPEDPPIGLVSWDELRQYAHEEVPKAVKRSVRGSVAKPQELEELTKRFVVNLERWLKVFERFGIPKIAETLAKNRVYGHKDWNGGNIMKRQGEYVLVDLGSAKTGPVSHKEARAAYKVLRELPVGPRFDAERRLAEHVLSSVGILRELSGGRAATIGLTIGRFQPFHKGHAELVRKMARQYDKVIVIVTDGKRDARSPFSYATRREMIELSLPDVEPKIEIYESKSGYLPEVLQHIVDVGGSSYEPGKAIEVVVGDDRFEQFKDQVARAAAKMDAGPDMSAVRVVRAPRTGDITGTKVREALADDDRQTVERMLDPHLLSDRTDFEELYDRLRTELTGGKPRVAEGLVREFLRDIASSEEDGARLLRDLVIARAPELQKRGVDVSGAKYLGHGRNGAAWKLDGGLATFKVTTDELEARSARQLLGLELEHIYGIFDVFSFEDGIYGIVQESLERLSGEDKAAFDRLISLLSSSYDGAERAVRRLCLGRAIMAVDEDDRQEMLGLLERFDLLGIVRDIKSVGIKSFDPHSGNIMRRGDTFVAIDLGTAGEHDGELDEEIDGTSSITLSKIGGGRAANEIIKLNAEQLSAYGISNPAPIGRPGNMGVAYDVGNNKILKVTVDADEAAANLRLVGKKNKHLNNVYHAFVFLNKHQQAEKIDAEVFGIIQDKLDELSDDENAEFSSAAGFLEDDSVVDTFATKPWSETIEKVRELVRQRAQDDMTDSQQVNVYTRKRMLQLTALFQKLQIPDMVDELRKNGIYFADLVSDSVEHEKDSLSAVGSFSRMAPRPNVMKRGTDFVINDLSKSQVTGGSISEVGITAGPRLGGVGSTGTSAWSSGILAAPGRDDTEDRESLLGGVGPVGSGSEVPRRGGGRRKAQPSRRSR